MTRCAAALPPCTHCAGVDQRLSLVSGSIQASTWSFVYRNDPAGVTTRFHNFSAGTNEDNGTGHSALGVLLAENLTLGNGFQPGGLVSGFDVFLELSSVVEDLQPRVDIVVELWDGDPFALFDGPANGYTGEPIPGTRVTFGDVPSNSGSMMFHAEFAPVEVPHQRVWMVLTSNACRLGWSGSFLKPSVGTDDPFDAWLGAVDVSQKGVCCGSQAQACDLTAGIPCPGDPTGSLEQCTDGHAESVFFFTWGGPCTGDPGSDVCSNLRANVLAPAQTVVAFVPVGNQIDNVLDPGVSIVGSRMEMETGGHLVFLELRVGSWAASGEGMRIQRALAEIELPDSNVDPLSKLTFYRPVCVDDEECQSMLGSGATCEVDLDGNLRCTAVFVDPNRADALFPSTLAPVCEVGSGQKSITLQCSSHNGSRSLPTSFPSQGLYAGTAVIEVDIDTLGVFDVSLLPVPGGGLYQPSGEVVPLVGFESGSICVGSSACGSSCPILSPPIPDFQLDQDGVTLMANAKNRYVSFTVDAAGVSSAVRITLVSIDESSFVSAGGWLLDSFAGWVGSRMWVAAPQDLCTLPSQGLGQECTEATPLQVSKLSCTPLFRDWSAVGLLHAFDPMIIPGATYAIQLIDPSCDITNEQSYSDSLLVSTPKWGDVVGIFLPDGLLWSIPDGSTNVVTDVVALLSAFKGEAGAPSKVRADLEGTDPTNRARLDGVITVGEVVRGIDGFKGVPYPFMPGECKGGQRDGLPCDPSLSIAESCPGATLCELRCPCDGCAP